MSKIKKIFYNKKISEVMDDNILLLLQLSVLTMKFYEKVKSWTLKKKFQGQNVNKKYYLKGNAASRQFLFLLRFTDS